MIVVASGLALPAQEEPQLIRGPYLQAVLARSARVLWRTDTPSVGRLTYRPPGGADRVVVEEAATTRHEVELTGLSPGTVYRYGVFAGDLVLASGDEFQFRTAPAPGAGQFRAVVIGDSGATSVGGIDQQSRITALLEELTPDLFLHTGDLVYDSTIDEVVFQEYCRLVSRICFYPARGNHSHIGVEEWFSYFSPPEAQLAFPPCELPKSVCDEDPPLPPEIPPWRTATFYSFDWGPAHFAVLDSNSDYVECSLQMKWLCADLAAARERDTPWIIIYLHHTVYTGGLYGAFPNAGRRLIPPIADRFGIDLVLTGHDHNYQRSYPLRGGATVDAWQDPDYRLPRGTIYIVTGGGGAVTYPELRDNGGNPVEDRRLFAVFHQEHHAVELEITPTRLKARALTPGRELLDEFVIAKDVERDEPGFLRGDANLDGVLDITDGVGLLNILFLGEDLDCPAIFPIVLDTNRTGQVNIADAVFLLNFLFLGGPAPGPPLAECEPLPELDDTDCLRASCRL